MLPKLLIGNDDENLRDWIWSWWLTVDSELIRKEFHPDLIVVPDGEVNSVGVNVVKELSKTLYLKPVESSVKVIIINKAELMTVEAQNAILKMLEEPPEYVQWFLVTEKPDSLLPTVLSRLGEVKVQSSKLKVKSSNEKEGGGLMTILSIVPAERLVQTPVLAKDRETAVKFINNWLIVAHRRLVYEESKDVWLMAVKVLDQGRKYLEANTHAQLTMDWVLLRLPVVR